nr:Ig-like domain-containing protein [Photorhabdus caribbeanensis]
MIKLRHRFLALFSTLVVVTSGVAHAELLEYSFKAPDGTQRSLSLNTTYANPTGNIKFTLSAGIDRKVRISVLKSDGTVVSTATSHLLGATDRITVGDKSYYGAELQLSAPDEGTYKLKAEILAADSSSVQTDQYDWIVDTTAPTLGSWTVSDANYDQTTSGNLWKLGTGGAEENAFILSDIEDTSPIKQVKYLLYRQNGSLFQEKDIGYDETNKQARVRYDFGFFPDSNLDEVFKTKFVITDEAGNVFTTPLQSMMFDNITNAPLGPFGVFDPDSNNDLGHSLSGFVPYKSGMTVKTNPIKLAWRVERNNWHEYREGGIKMLNSLGEMSKVSEDSQYVYLVTTSPYGHMDGNYWRWINFGQWGGGEISYNLTLAPSVPQSPKLLGVDYNYSDIGWSSMYRYWVKNSTLPVSVNEIRVKVEPRPYVQTAVHRGSCEIPIGQDNCIISNSFTMEKGTTGYIHDNVTVYNPEKSLMSNPMWAEVNWNDQHYPQLTQSYDAENKIFTLFVTQAGRGSYFDRLHLKEAWIEDSKGNKLSPTGGLIANNWENYTYQWDLKTLPEGQFNLVAAAEEMHGPLTKQPMFQITSDRTAPIMTISISDGSSIRTLDDVIVTLSDAIDPSPKLTSISLVGGPAADKVQLSWREESKGRFRLEYPVMFPSLKTGESYTLTVKGQDAQGNIVQKGVGFEYKPRQVTLADGMDGKLMIPAVTHEFTHADGSRIIETKPLMLNDNSVVKGVYDVFATLRSDAKVPLIVNGVRIEPGQTMSIMNQHNFGSSGGKLSIPVKPAIPDVVGTSSLLVTTAAPNAPILVLDIHTWKAFAKLTAESWEVQQVIDPVKIFALPETGVPCRFTSKEEEARRADPIRDPVCLLQWDRTPDESEQSTQETDGLKLAGLIGQAVSLGEQPVEYSLHLFSGDGSKVKVGGGSRNLVVKTAYGTIGYTPGNEIAQVNRVIENFDVRFTQNLGTACSPTLNADQAKHDASTKYAGSLSRTCLFEWLTIPDGLTQDQNSTIPGLSGTLAEKSIHTLGWRISAYSKNGTRITLNDQTFNIEAIDPLAPTIELSSKYNFKDNIYMVPMLGDYLGDVTISSERADLDIAITRNDDILESETFSSGRGGNIKVYRRINTDQRGLWEETIYRIKAAYNKVPDVQTEAVYRTISTPPYSIVPIVEVQGDTAIDTQPLPIKVLIRDQYKPTGAYDANTMGIWKVRLIRQMAYDQVETLTDYVESSSGEANFNVDLSKVNAPSIRIVAEAVLNSPIEGYSRVVQSTRPSFLTVLKGGTIAAKVVARRLSGETPFKAVFTLELADRQDYRATGNVVWDVSKDDGKTWQSFTPEERYKYQLVQTFEKGKYKVRAKVINRNSGAEAYTEIVDVIAYDKPKLAVIGPQTLFVGSEGKFTTKMTVNDQEISSSDVVIEWSTDDGKTYDQQGPSISLSRDTDTRVKLWARVRAKEAPADDDYAYRVAKTAVEFRAIKPPRPYISGPSVIETGKTYTFKANTSLPYKGMDVQIKGFFTLPNGKKVEGDTAQYTPSGEDLTKEKVETTYTAWIEGFRNKGAEASHTIHSKIWQYVWPKFGMQVRKTADVAPAIITINVKPIGFSGKLEEPVYEWELPKNAVVEDQKQPPVRSFTLKEAGEYSIKLKIRDARGNESMLEESVKLGEAEKYVIDLQYSGSNPNNREPLDVLLRPYISGGHPRDKILTRQFMVDGKPLESTGFYGRTTLTAGEHKIQLKVMSEMGHEVEGLLILKVAENQLPTCAIRSRETIGSWIVYAECEDKDGRIKSYEWTVGGEKQSTTADRLTISKRKSSIMPKITLIGIDDSGGKSEVITLNGS